MPRRRAESSRMASRSPLRRRVHIWRQLRASLGALLAERERNSHRPKRGAHADPKKLAPDHYSQHHRRQLHSNPRPRHPLRSLADPSSVPHYPGPCVVAHASRRAASTFVSTSGTIAIPNRDRSPARSFHFQALSSRWSPIFAPGLEVTICDLQFSKLVSRVRRCMHCGAGWQPADRLAIGPSGREPGRAIEPRPSGAVKPMFWRASTGRIVKDSVAP